METYREDFIEKLGSHPTLDATRRGDVDVDLLAHLAREAMTETTAVEMPDRIRQSALEIGLMTLVCAHPAAQAVIQPVKGVGRG
jgi:hypothetical protein